MQVGGGAGFGAMGDVVLTFGGWHLGGASGRVLGLGLLLDVCF